MLHRLIGFVLFGLLVVRANSLDELAVRVHELTRQGWQVEKVVSKPEKHEATLSQSNR